MSLKRTFWNTPSTQRDRVEAMPAGKTRPEGGGGAPETLVEPCGDDRAVGSPLDLRQHRGDEGRRIEHVEHIELVGARRLCELGRVSRRRCPRHRARERLELDCSLALVADL